MKVRRVIEIEEDALKFVQELTEIIIPARSGKTLQKNVIEAIKFSKPYDLQEAVAFKEEIIRMVNMGVYPEAIVEWVRESEAEND